MTKIALFGTSADPPTAGHQAILYWLSQQYDWVAVWASDNPFKQHQTTLEHRMMMLELLIQEISPPRHNIQLRKELSHRRSLTSVEKAKEIWGKKAEYTLVIGSDLVGQIRHWYQIEKLLQQVSLLIIPRPGYFIKNEEIIALQRLGGKCEIADLTAPKVSSTDYREKGDSAVVTKPGSRVYSSRAVIRMKPSTNNLINSKTLADFKVGVDNVIFSIDTQHNRLLVLVKRSDEPFANDWSLPGTLVRYGESLEDAAYRILAEKIRVNNLYLEQLYTFGGPSRDPRESPDSFGVRYLSVSYFALVRFEEAELIDTQYNSTAWYIVQKVPNLAFDHNQILDYGYRRLKNKLEYSPIAFDVLPELFTLNDLYQFYGTILGDNFSDYSNFRNRLLKLGFLCDTGIKVSKGAGRPASLYRFDAESFAPLKDKPLVFI